MNELTGEYHADVTLLLEEIAALKAELKSVVDHYSEYADPVLDESIELLRDES